RAWTGFSGPNQATAVVIDHLWVGVQEFVLEILEGIIIQVELPFERAIGHAASPLEQGNRLIESLLKGHGRPSTTLALVPKESNVRHRGVYRESAPQVYQESGGAAGEIAPLGRAPNMGLMGKQPEKFRKKGNGLSPSVPEGTTP